MPFDVASQRTTHVEKGDGQRKKRKEKNRTHVNRLFLTFLLSLMLMPNGGVVADVFVGLSSCGVRCHHCVYGSPERTIPKIKTIFSFCLMLSFTFSLSPSLY